jgi:hypothetical protein
MIKQLSARQAIVDAEVAVPAERGVTNISLLDDALAAGSLDRLAFYEFDLLVLNDKDLRSKPLAERKLSSFRSCSPIHRPDYSSGSLKPAGLEFSRPGALILPTSVDIN